MIVLQQSTPLLPPSCYVASVGVGHTFLWASFVGVKGRGGQAPSQLGQAQACNVGGDVFLSRSADRQCPQGCVMLTTHRMNAEPKLVGNWRLLALHCFDSVQHVFVLKGCQLGGDGCTRLVVGTTVSWCGL
jgi:hypothetical protein